MADVLSSPPSPGIRKRPAPDDTSIDYKPLNLKASQFMVPTPPDTEESSPMADNTVDRAGSPTPSSSALSSIGDPGSAITSTNMTGVTTQTSSTPSRPTGQPPQKRRKLSPTEKLEQARLKEAKAAEKAEQKAKKEQEQAEKAAELAEKKGKKDEEKRLKDEEVRAKAEEKEAKKREKELEEERKNQEKLKKERSQMRLGAFFQKPATPAKSPAPGDESDETAFRARRRSLSLETFDNVADKILSASPVKGTPEPLKPQLSSKDSVPDYHKHFLPFDVQAYTTLATSRWSSRSPADIEEDQRAFDASISDPLLQEKYDLGIVDSYGSIADYFTLAPDSSRGYAVPSARSIVDQIHGNTSQQPIDLTTSQNPLTALQNLTRRYLHFHEDVRPAYYGTYTQLPPRPSHTTRNPISRGRTDTDYDYDSEAEWEEPEEGEDILGDEEDEAESNGDADEMDGFLDDENDELKHKRKMITGDLVPISTGLCWENEAGKIIASIESDEPANTMRGMRLAVLLTKFASSAAAISIDPFSTAYWEPDIMPPPAMPVREVSRPPLKERLNSSNALIGAAEGQKGPINSVSSTAAPGEKRGRKAAPKVLSKEDMDEFKDAVVGSQLGKLELCKGLKAR